MKLKIGDWLFIGVVIIHILTRQWPYGGTLQTIFDFLIVAVLILEGFKLWAGKGRK